MPRSLSIPSPDPTDPAHLAPDQRLDEIAAILAPAIARLLELRAATVPAPAEQISADSEQISLDVSAESRLHVRRELTQAESAEGVKA